MDTSWDDDSDLFNALDEIESYEHHELGNFQLNYWTFQSTESQTSSFQTTSSRVSTSNSSVQIPNQNIASTINMISETNTTETEPPSTILRAPSKAGLNLDDIDFLDCKFDEVEIIANVHVQNTNNSASSRLESTHSETSTPQIQKKTNCS